MSDPSVSFDITQRVHEFWSSLDRNDYARMAELFAVDGVWDRFGTLIQGREQLLQVLEARAKGAVTCHLVSNVVVTPRGADAADVAYYVVVFAHMGQEGSKLPRPIGVPHSIHAATQEMIRDGSTWRMKRLALLTQFAA